MFTFVGLPLVLFLSTTLTPAKPLDGRSFNVMSGKTGELDERGSQTTLVFADGKLLSTSCADYGYAASEYSAKKIARGVEFEARLTSVKYGTNVWRGIVKGAEISGVLLATDLDKNMSELTFVGRAPVLATPPLHKIERLLGAWKMNLVLESAKPVAKAHGTWSCANPVDGMGLDCTASIRGVPGMSEYKLRGLFGHDGNKYHWYSISNAAETHDHAGAFVDERTLSFSWAGEQDGKQMTEKVDFIFRGPRRVSGVGEIKIDGQVVDRQTFELTR